MAHKERGNAGNLENESPKTEAIIFYRLLPINK